MKLSDEQLPLLDNVVKDFRIALKNSVLYVQNHPLCLYSINNLKNSLDKWFARNDNLELGISQSQLFFGEEPVKEKDEGYGELARFLHFRGLLSLSIQRGIDAEEIGRFLALVKRDRKILQTEGGILKSMPPEGRIRIREIDYSALLQSARQNAESSEEGKIWRFLFTVAEESKSGELPPSKVEFLVDFFKDSKQSAKTLNKVYRDATTQLTDESAAKNIKGAIAQICQYLDSHKGENAKELRVQLMHVVAQLHPDLIKILFDQTVGGEEQIDLAQEITKDFSEDTIAEFIESLLSNEDSFNENLLKMFDKLTPGQSKSNNVVSLVADKLFRKRAINPETLTQLQMSIMEIFRKHPESDFMNQIYKITVDSVMNKKIDTLVYMARLSPLINKFVQSMEEEQLNTEKIWLLLNILWLENNPVEFKRFTDKLVSVMPDLLDAKDVVRIREIVEFFTEKVRPEQKANAQMEAEIRAALGRITDRRTIDHIISLVPEATQKDLEDIVYTLIRSQANCAKNLVDAFLAERNPAHRHKFWFVFSMMKPDVARETINRLEYGEPGNVKDLFLILKECDPKKTRLAARKLIGHLHPQVRWEALDAFEPRSPDEVEAVFRVYRREKHRTVKKKAAVALLRTSHAPTVSRLFRSCERDWFRPANLIELVDLCGHARVPATFPHLLRLFDRRGWWLNRRRDDLRTAVVTSASKMGTDEARALVQRAKTDKSRRVREVSEILLKLEEG